jgi:hypothetical protein
MVEACSVCDTLWRLYTQAADNLHQLNGKHTDARGKGDQTTVEILAHEITIAESTLPIVRRELRRHEQARHGATGKSDSNQREKELSANAKK